MKKLMKFAAALLLVIAFAQNSNAQVKFNAGLDVGFATNDGLGLMYGGTVGAEKPLGDNMGLCFDAGYDIISNDGEGVTSSLIPMQAGFKYYFTDNEGGLYAKADLGVSMYKISGGFISYSTTGLSYGAGLGYLASEHIDLGARFNMVSVEGGNLQYIAVRAAYRF